MHSLKGNFTGNNTTSEIILFEVPSNRHSSTGGVGVVGRECPRAKAESKKQCVDPESTSVWIGIGWRWSGAHTRGETRGIQREFGSERVDALRRIGLVVAQTSSTRLPVCKGTPNPWLRSDPVADPILLCNIGSYSHHSESTPLPPNTLFLFRP